MKNIDIDIDIDGKSLKNIDKGIIKKLIKEWSKMGAKCNNFCLFSAFFVVLSLDLLMEYQILISIVNTSTNLKNIDSDKTNIFIFLSREKVKNILMEMCPIPRNRLYFLILSIVFFKNVNRN